MQMYNYECCEICNVKTPSSVCHCCKETGRHIISFVKKLKPNTTVKLSSALQWMKEMEVWKEREEKKVNFLESNVVALKEGIDTDILLQPETGPALYAHRALLVSKSEIFRTMLSKDECKARAEAIISLPGLTHDDLRCFVDFLYSGNLPVHEKLTSNDNIEELSISLLIAADKYEIHFLKSVCESRILESLTPGNALEVLELAFRSSSGRLKEQALNVIVIHANNILPSAEYYTFAMKNPHLGIDISRALLKKIKKRKSVFLP